MLFMKQTIVMLVAFLILFSTSSALANSPRMIYDKSYLFDGSILMKVQIGDSRNSTAEHKTLVDGRGRLSGYDSYAIGRGYLDVIKENSWEAEDSLIGGLTVASTVKINEEAGEESENNSEQVFAVMVTANPGEEGGLSQEMSASSAVYSENGENFFIIDQSAYTSGGEVKRYIDLTEPVTGEYIFEDTVIRGYVEINDSLQMVDESSGSLVFELGRRDSETTEPDSQLEKLDTGEDEELYILYGEGLFEKTVLVGTLFEEIELIQSIDLVTDLVTITGIEVEWNEDTVAAYDPEQLGEYLFEGSLQFPEKIATPGQVVVYYTVNVVEELPAEQEIDEADETADSDHLEDTVHGRDDREDEQTDEETDNQ